MRVYENRCKEGNAPYDAGTTRAGNLYYADLWYYPKGPEADVAPQVINLQISEMGYYHVPTYMADPSGDLTFQVPLRACIAIDSWVYIFIADIVFGLFSRGARIEKRLDEDLAFKLRVLSKAIYEGRQVLECSELVRVGKNSFIDPSAIIHGPTTIGDNVHIDAGAVIDNCIIGNNVNVSQDVQLMVSVVGDGTFLPLEKPQFEGDFGSFQTNPHAWRQVSFLAPISGRYLRLVYPHEVNKTKCVASAEIEILVKP